MNWRSDKIWQIISAIAALLAIIATVLIFFFSQQDKSKQIEATVLSRTSLLGDDVENTKSEFKLTYKGKEIPNVSILQTQIRNSGAQPITSADIEEPITLEIQGTDEIISAKVVTSVPPDLTVSTSIEANLVKLSKGLLNPEDEFTVEVKCVKNSEIMPFVKTVTGRIAGIKRINFQTSLPTSKPKFSIFLSVFASTLATVVAVFVFTLMHRLLKKLQIKVKE